MRNTTGLYKHQRDNQGKRRRLQTVALKGVLVQITQTPVCQKCGHETGSPAHQILCEEKQ